MVRTRKLVRLAGSVLSRSGVVMEILADAPDGDCRWSFAENPFYVPDEMPRELTARTAVVAEA